MHSSPAFVHCALMFGSVAGQPAGLGFAGHFDTGGGGGLRATGASVASAASAGADRGCEPGGGVFGEPHATTIDATKMSRMGRMLPAICRRG